MKSFIKNLAADSRIPKQDKKVVIGLLSLVLLLPLLFTTEEIPLAVKLVVLIMFALVVDYFFIVLDSTIVLSHYPWSMKSFARLQRIGQFFSFFVPGFIKNNLWKYERDPF
jgi:hypothetical protein